MSKLTKKEIVEELSSVREDIADTTEKLRNIYEQKKAINEKFQKIQNELKYLEKKCEKFDKLYDEAKAEENRIMKATYTLDNDNKTIKLDWGDKETNLWGGWLSDNENEKEKYLKRFDKQLVRLNEAGQVGDFITKQFEQLCEFGDCDFYDDPIKAIQKWMRKYVRKVNNYIKSLC